MCHFALRESNMSKQTANQKNKSQKQVKGRGRKQKTGPLNSAFAPLTRRTLKYTDNKMLTETAAGAGAHYVYALGGMYDPDFTGVGSQPMWFDQLLTVSGPYLKYRVTDASVVVTFANNTNGNVYVYWNATVSSATPASLVAAQQKPFSQFALLNPNTSGRGQRVFRARFDLAKILGITRNHLLNDDYYAGSYTANPLSQPYLQVGVFAAPGGAVVGQVNVTVEIDYHAQVYQLSPNAATS